MTPFPIEVSPVFERLLARYEAGFKKFALEGGSRSTKTWSIFILLNHYCRQHAGRKKRITIARKHRTTIKGTIYKDLIEFVEHYGLSDYIKCVNMAELIFDAYGNEIQLIGLDDPQKAHGRKQHVVWINEVMEVSLNSASQLMMRTDELVICDWNPSESKHWMFDLLRDPSWSYDHSVYKDNPFLSRNIIETIEGYEPTPENIERGTANKYRWEVYGLGLRAKKVGLILQHWQKYGELPQGCRYLGHGVDFGFAISHAAVIKCWERKISSTMSELYWRQVLYALDLTDLQMCERLDELGVNKKEDYICDSARPDSIKQMRMQGFKALPVRKTREGTGYLEYGIKTLQTHKIFAHENSVDLHFELDNWMWKLDADNDSLGKEDDRNNHLIKAGMYNATHFLGKAAFNVA